MLGDSLESRMDLFLEIIYIPKKQGTPFLKFE